MLVIKTGELETIGFFINSIKNSVPASEAVKCFSGMTIDSVIYAALDEAAQNLPLGEKMRVYASASLAAEGNIREMLERLSFTCVREMIENATPDADFNDIPPLILSDRVEISLPLRVNWGGSWTDAPPYCLENGGAVVNAAVRINKILPVKVVIEKINDSKVILEYFDSGYRCEFTNVGELSDFSSDADHFPLLKAALVVCGLISLPGAKPIIDIFDKLCGGLLLSAGVVGIPKGSGLGTSSILLAACIKCILCFLGYDAQDQDICRRVLLAEQIMGTGGGWQDQAGGITSGIKLISSSNGNRQDVRVQHLHAPNSFLNSLNNRFCLVYSGQRRLGRTVLREIMGGYIRRNPVFIHALEEIFLLAGEMKANIESGSMEGFIENINRQTELTMAMDTGYINERIGRILESCSDLTAGRMICGAGGGGFLQIILKQGYSKEDLNRRLKTCFYKQGIEVWDCDFYNGFPADN